MVQDLMLSFAETVRTREWKMAMRAIEPYSVGGGNASVVCSEMRLLTMFWPLDHVSSCALMMSSRKGCR